MTEVDYGGGGHRTRLKINDQFVYLWGAPLSVYKGVEEGRGQPSLWRALGECYLLSTALDFPEEERMMQQSSVSISLSF